MICSSSEDRVRGRSESHGAVRKAERAASWRKPAEGFAFAGGRRPSLAARATTREAGHHRRAARNQESRPSGIRTKVARRTRGRIELIRNPGNQEKQNGIDYWKTRFSIQGFCRIRSIRVIRGYKSPCLTLWRNFGAAEKSSVLIDNQSRRFDVALQSAAGLKFTTFGGKDVALDSSAHLD